MCNKEIKIPKARIERRMYSIRIFFLLYIMMTIQAVCSTKDGNTRDY